MSWLKTMLYIELPDLSFYITHTCNFIGNLSFIPNVFIEKINLCTFLRLRWILRMKCFLLLFLIEIMPITRKINVVEIIHNYCTLSFNIFDFSKTLERYSTYIILTKPYKWVSDCCLTPFQTFFTVISCREKAICNEIMMMMSALY